MTRSEVVNLDHWLLLVWAALCIIATIASWWRLGTTVGSLQYVQSKLDFIVVQGEIRVASIFMVGSVILVGGAYWVANHVHVIKRWPAPLLLGLLILMTLLIILRSLSLIVLRHRLAKYEHDTLAERTICIP
jgi:uncharacterized protein YhhL (DUF1145 family)